MITNNQKRGVVQSTHCCAVMAVICLTAVGAFQAQAQVSSPAAALNRTTVDWSSDGRTLAEMADEAKQKGITTVLINRPYFAPLQIEFPPLNTLSAAFPIPNVHVLLLRDEENVTEANEDDTDLRTWIKFAVVENLTGKPLDSADPPRAPDQMAPPNASELILLEREGSLAVKGVTFIHSAPDLSFFRPKQLYLVVAWVSGSEMSFIAEPPAAFLVSATGTLHPVIADSPIARNVRLTTGNSLEALRLFIAQHQSSSKQ